MGKTSRASFTRRWWWRLLKERQRENVFFFYFFLGGGKQDFEHAVSAVGTLNPTLVRRNKAIQRVIDSRSDKMSAGLKEQKKANRPVQTEMRSSMGSKRYMFIVFLWNHVICWIGNWAFGANRFIHFGYDLILSFVWFIIFCCGGVGEEPSRNTTYLSTFDMNRDLQNNGAVGDKRTMRWNKANCGGDSVALGDNTNGEWPSFRFSNRAWAWENNHTLAVSFWVPFLSLCGWTGTPTTSYQDDFSTGPRARLRESGTGHTIPICKVAWNPWAARRGQDYFGVIYDSLLRDLFYRYQNTHMQKREEEEEEEEKK